MTFRAVFIALVIATALIISAYLVNSRRPRVVVEQPSAAFVRASGKCAECHLNTQYSIVHEFERHLLTQNYSLSVNWWQRIIVHDKKIKGWHFSPSHFQGQDLIGVWLDQ